MLLRSCLIFLLVLCVISVCVAKEPQFRSDYKYNEKAAGWFKVHPVPVDWHTARIICHYEGAELASPLNPAMLESIRDLVKNSEPTLPLYYSGVHQTFGDGVYTSIEGVPLEKLHVGTWSPGEPNNYGKSQQCLAYSNDNTVWDISCKDYHPYICYRKFSETNLTECGTVDEAYKSTKTSNHCYKLHFIDQYTWDRAHKVCIAEGGYLAIINSKEEADLIDNILNLNSTRIPLQRAFKAEYMAIGYRSWEENDSWWTVHGQPLREAGFDRWELNEPSRSNPEKTNSSKSCGGLRNKKLFNIYCDVPYSFICEKEVGSLID